MAEAKKNSAGSGSRQKKGSSEKTQDAPKGKTESAKKPESKPAVTNDQNQFWSIILFAAGILIAFMIVIKGSAGWHKIHSMLLGLFGAAVIFVPITLIYTAIQIGMEKSQKRVTGRAVWGIAMAFLFSAALQIFFVGKLPGRNFWNHFTVLYENGVNVKGGGKSPYCRTSSGCIRRNGGKNRYGYNVLCFWYAPDRQRSYGFFQTSPYAFQISRKLSGGVSEYAHWRKL